jgi:hypothetical protein
MPRSLPRRILVPFTLAAVLAAASFAAAGPASAPTPRRVALAPAPHVGTYAGGWDWLRTVWAMASCVLDPGGRCLPSGAALVHPHIDGACVIDPGGVRCRRGGLHTDEGCVLDPGGTHCLGG